MTDLLAVTLPEMIAEVRRELELRRRVYPRMVAGKQMSQRAADRHIEVMDAVLRFLEASDGG